MSAQTDVKFSQSEAVTRCRNVKEAKLKGNYALVKLADEEGNQGCFVLKINEFFVISL